MLPPSALGWWRTSPIYKCQISSPCSLLLDVHFCQLPLLSYLVRLLQNSCELSLSEKKRKKGKVGCGFCKITEFSSLTEGAWTSSKDKQCRRSRKINHICLVAISHLAGALFMALSIQDAEPELLAHQADKMHVPKEVQDRREAWNPTFCFSTLLRAVLRAISKTGI